MMRENKLRRILREGKTSVSTRLWSTWPLYTESVGATGNFDYVEFVAEYADRVGLFFEGNIVTSKEARAFFAGNNFYTTAANRMARHYFPNAVTGKEVVRCLQANL